MKEKACKSRFKGGIFGIILALAMVVTLLPMNSLSVYAKDFTITASGDLYTGVTYEVPDAAKSAKAGDTIILKNNSEKRLYFNCTIPGGGSKSLDLNPGQIGTITIPSGYYVYRIDASGDMVYVYCAAVIPVTKVEIDKQELSLAVGETATLATVVTPDNADDASLLWKSDNESIATVKDGVVTAVAPGKAMITVQSVSNPDVYATCLVTVAAPAADSKAPKTGETSNMPLAMLIFAMGVVALGFTSKKIVK